MTTFEKIAEALKKFEYPCGPDVNKDDATHWFTYNFSGDKGMGFADDEPEEIVNSVQIHLFMPIQENFIKIKNEVRKSLFESGFTFPEITVLVEETRGIRHIIFECDIEEEEN